VGGRSKKEENVTGRRKKEEGEGGGRRGRSVMGQPKECVGADQINI
jgi:hypothetical protein